LNMSENLRDQWRIFDAGDHPEFAAAIRTGLDVDGEYALQSLHPAHRRGGFIAVDAAARGIRHDAFAVLKVGRKYSVETSQVESGARHECGEPCYEIQRRG
jgi:hypothetical protein